jgi:hypothetical protein
VKAASTPEERITSVMKSCTSFVQLVSRNVLIAEDSTALSAIQRDAPGAAIKIEQEGFNSEWVLFAEAAESAYGATIGHLFNPDTPSAEFSRFCYTLARNNYSRANIITTPAETTGFWPDFKGPAHFSTHSSSYKSECLSIHLFITHPDAEPAEDTSIIFHGKSDFEQSHTGSDVLGYFHIWGAGN